MKIDNGSAIDRRDFLKTSSLLIMAVTASLSSCDNDAERKDASPCVTSEDILGPYYKAGAPERQDIIPAGNTTPPLIIQGKVFSGCNEVLQDAKVEIWNADEDGEYDLSENFIFRGSQQSSADGIYKFETIIPGRYLNGATYRPSHIHFRITAPGHAELISQVYFADDPFIDDDPWASDPSAESRILTLTKDDQNVDTVNFDIHLSITA